jgi:acyl-CoA synthetase (AMP-forming)/AMP-acid ligase II
VAVSWLPLFHDMGLVLSIATPIAIRMRSVLMDPLAFVERPERWLRALSSNPGALTAAPSFAYALAAARVTEAEKLRLRLDTVTGLIDGSEPVQPGAIRRFREAFEPCGLRPESHRPSYGLAEATVFVSTSVAGGAPVELAADRAALALGRVEAGTDDTAVLVSCGKPLDQRALIVDPATRLPKPDGEVGEIWLSGPNIGRGYWERPEESAETFGNTLADGTGHWLRTGDLGAIHQGELYITGRIKDLVIVDGRNHYPHDVEHTAEHAHQAIRRRNVVAFAVPTADGERAVVLAERARDAADPDLTEVAAAIRAAVSYRHGLALHDVRLVEPDSLPRTSSGKIARSTCRADYLAGAQ